METRSIQVRRTARYHLLGDPQDFDELWLCLHGYAQDAGRFLGEFEPLRRPGRLLAAPEGLSRFYLRGSSGRVGASWMTSVEREAEIADYVAFLGQLRDELMGERTASVNLIGFSQGSHAAARFACYGERAVERLILWGGDFPDDIEVGRAQAALDQTRVQLVIGDADEYLPEDRVARIEEHLRRVDGGAELVRFTGGHHLDAAVLTAVVDGSSNEE